MEASSFHTYLYRTALILTLIFIIPSTSFAQTGQVDLEELKRKLQDKTETDLMSIESVEPKNKGTAVSSYGLTRADFKRLTKLVGMLGTVIPIRAVEDQVVYGENQSRCQVIGTSPDFMLKGSTKTSNGRFLTYKDTRTAENVCVINEQVARQFFQATNPIGKSIRIKDSFFTVVGVNKTKRPTSIKNERVIFIPHTTMYMRFGDLQMQNDKGSFKASNVQLHEIVICLNKSADPSKTFGQIKSLMRKIHPANDYTIQFASKTK